MDTLTHALSGALVARLIAARTDRPTAGHGASPLSTTAAGFDAPWRGGDRAPQPWQCVVVGLVAGAFPDSDAVVQLVSELAYLRHHRGITHSLLLAPAWAWLVAWVFAQVFQVTRGVGGGWKSWYAVALGGILIHIAGDWITGFGTMLLEPFSDHRFALGSTFIIDLTLSGVVLAGVLGAALLPRRRWPAGLSLVLAMGWVGVSWVGKGEAQAAGEAFARAQGLVGAEVQAIPRPASPFNWTVAVRDGDTYHLAHLNTRRVQPLVASADDSFIRRFSAPYQPVATVTWERIERFGDDPAGAALAREAWERPEFGFYRWFAQAPVLERVEPGAGTASGGERCAWFRDLRFGFPGRGDAPFRYGVCLSDGAGGVREARVYTRDRDDGEVVRVSMAREAESGTGAAADLR